MNRFANLLVTIDARFGDQRAFQKHVEIYQARKSQGAAPELVTRYVYSFPAFRPSGQKTTQVTASANPHNAYLFMGTQLGLPGLVEGSPRYELHAHHVEVTGSGADDIGQNGVPLDITGVPGGIGNLDGHRLERGAFRRR